MTDKKFFVEEIEVLTPEDIKAGKDEGTIWPAVTDPEKTVTYECRNEDVARELCEYMNKQEEKLFIEETDCKNAKESRDYWRNKAKELEKENKRLKRFENKVKQIPPKIKEVWLE